jgi:hypothetical protein
MNTQFARLAGILVVMLLVLVPVRAQSPNPDAAAAAKELIDTMKLGDQFKAILPAILNQMKPAIVQNRPDVERDVDAIMPILLQKMSARIGELEDAVVSIYASNFTAVELRELTAFYKSPTGQKFLQKTPIVTQQTMAAGQKFGQSAGAEAQKEIIETLRSKGHAL